MPIARITDRIFGHPILPEVPPIICLHGFAGSPADWQPIVGQNVHSLGLSIPGHAPDCPAPSGFDDAVRQLLARWPTQPASVVGYSLGGRLALAIAALAPERVKHLILVAAHTGLDSSQARSDRVALDRQRAEQLRADPDRFFAQWDQLPMFQGPPTPHLKPWLIRRAQHNPAELAHTMTALSLGRMPNYRDPVFSSSVPCLLVVGGQDTKAWDHYRTVLSAYPHLSLRVLPNAAHRVPVDAPEALSEVITTELGGAHRR